LPPDEDDVRFLFGLRMSGLSPVFFGVNGQAQDLIESLLIVAAVLFVSILFAWQIYGSTIEELYEAREPSKLRPLSLGEPALKTATSPVDWTRTWHTTRQQKDQPQKCNASTCVYRQSLARSRLITSRRFDPPTDGTKKTR